jgi:monovalent cation:H+ antiporter-2, CPA2 family
VQGASAAPEAKPKVIVVGYGRVGGLVSELLARHDVPYVALDSDSALAARERRGGKPIYFGDAGSPELLRRFGIAFAQALVVTMDSPVAVESVVTAARAERPDLVIVARARDAEHASNFTIRTLPTLYPKRSRQAFNYPKPCWSTSAFPWVW